MSVYLSDRGENKFEVLVKARELAVYTIQITHNKNVFSDYDTVVNDLQKLGKDIFIGLWYANTVNDGGEMDVTYDKVFIPSLEEMYINPQISGEGEAHEYYKRQAGTTSPLAQYGTYPQMITYAVENHTSAQIVRLRSAARGDAGHTWIVYSSGYVGYYGAHSAGRFCPLIVI